MTAAYHHESCHESRKEIIFVLNHHRVFEDGEKKGSRSSQAFINFVESGHFFIVPTAMNILLVLACYHEQRQMKCSGIFFASFSACTWKIFTLYNPKRLRGNVNIIVAIEFFFEHEMK